jgi:glycosyltransferase involved in cell wall biosynthesis
MARVLHNRDLRASLVEKGYARASAYSWETMTRRIHAFIESVSGAA